METFIGIGFIFLCVAVLVGIAGIFGYQIYLHKEKAEISPSTEISKSNNTTNE